MPIDVYPAIDLISGCVVRLVKGEFHQKTIYSRDPVAIAREYEEAGARRLHVVDLDGAKEGKPCQVQVIQNLVKTSGLAVQVGGGIRSLEAIKVLLECGVDKVVVGSLAVNNQPLTEEALDQFGSEHITVAIDCKVDSIDSPRIFTHGWQKDGLVTVWDLLTSYGKSGLRHILCTDIDRDGVMTGPNLDLYREVVARFPDLVVQASGGVASLEDIRHLKEINLGGIITGKALLEKKFTLGQALEGLTS